MSASRMPVLFLGHGSPMNAIEDNRWSREWNRLGQDLPRPKAVLCISAHWETSGAPVVGAAERPETIHDFFGFPQPLHDAQYPAPGDPALAARVSELLTPDQVAEHPTRGLDHGAWSVLMPMYPLADVPVVQLSIDRAKPDAWHHEAGARLAALRDEGVLIIGSGDIVHNLRAADFRRPESPEWAQRFHAVSHQLLAARDDEALTGYRHLGPDAELAINSAEHYLPLLYVLGASSRDEPMRVFNDDLFAALSMTSLQFG